MASDEQRAREGIPVGRFLAAILALMAIANGALIWLAGRDPHHLVRPDYYQAGLDQDGFLARNARANPPGQRIGIWRDSRGWKVEAAVDSTRAEVCRAHFYRPDDVKADRQLVLARGAGSEARVGGRATWEGPPLALRRGHWQVRLVWEQAGRPVMETTLPFFAAP